MGLCNWTFCSGKYLSTQVSLRGNFPGQVGDLDDTVKDGAVGQEATVKGKKRRRVDKRSAGERRRKKEKCKDE